MKILTYRKKDDIETVKDVIVKGSKENDSKEKGGKENDSKEKGGKDKDVTEQGCVGILHKDGRHVCDVSRLGLPYTSVNALIGGLTDKERKVLLAAENAEIPEEVSGKASEKASEKVLEGLSEALPEIAPEAASWSEIFENMENIELLAPVPQPKQDIICLGVNYAAHAEESARYKKEAFDLQKSYPVYFSKRVNQAVGHGAPVRYDPALVDSLDYEVELAVIIGRDCFRVKKEDAASYIFGYTILNDVSARNLQTRHSQWYFGKSLDNFCPMGPWIVTADELPFPPALKIQSRINGELRQDSTTDMLIFGIGEVIEELSQGMTLQTGTIISMGTPSGVGMGFCPPKFLKPGDVMTCEIEGIGVLCNKIERI